MSSRKRRQVKTIEVGRLRELHKLKISIKEKTKEILKCLMSVFISDIDKAKLYVQFSGPLAQCAISLKC